MQHSCSDLLYFLIVYLVGDRTEFVGCGTAHHAIIFYAIQ